MTHVLALLGVLSISFSAVFIRLARVSRRHAAAYSITPSTSWHSVRRRPRIRSMPPSASAQPATQPYGLLGPVRLVPYGRATIALP